MDFLECVKGRRSIRKFTDQKVEHETFEKIVEAASYSPSWKNSQISRYTLIEDRALLDRLAADCVMDFKFNANNLEKAPAAIVVSMISKRCGYEKDGSFSTSKEDKWEMFDAGIATQTLCLAAYEAGLGTVILGVFDDEKVKEAVGIPENETVATVVCIGYPDEAPSMPKRKDVKDLVTYK